MEKTRVLVVDDEHDFTQVLRDRLAFEGFEVDVAYDGHAAIERLKSFSPHIILLDIMMPRMDGFAFLQRWRQEASAAATIVVVTAYGREPSARELALLDGAPILRKPFDVEALLEIIRKSVPA